MIEINAEKKAAIDAQLIAPLGLERIACAKLDVDGWDVAGVERSKGISGGFVFDDVLYAFLSEEQTDTDYIVTPGDNAAKFTDHVEIPLNGRVVVSFIIERVQ